MMPLVKTGKAREARDPEARRPARISGLIDFLVDWEKGEMMRALCGFVAFSYVPDFYKEVGDFFCARCVLNLRIWMQMICCISVWTLSVQAQLPLQYAQGFRVDYFDDYRVVTVLAPGGGEQEKVQYVLVQRGHKSPDGYEGVPRIEIPVRTLITTSTTHLPHLEKLGEVHSLIGIDNIKFVNSEVVNQRFAEGKLTEVGRDRTIDLEKVLVLQPDLVIADTYTQENVLVALQEAGVPVVINAAYAESSLLGRVEWIKFVGAFFNKEERATAQLDSIVVRYEAFRSLTQNLPMDKRPTVFGGSLWRGTWFMAGGKTYPAQLLRDAGANYLWADDDSRQSLALDFETVYEKAHDADCWITMKNGWFSRDDVVAEDERYRKFTAFETGNVFNANARLNAHGGNDYWETGLIEPDVVLADIIKILHPHLLPNHQLKYYRKLDP